MLAGQRIIMILILFNAMTVMPVFYALLGKRAIANHDAVAYEKAGEVI